MLLYHFISCGLCASFFFSHRPPSCSPPPPFIRRAAAARRPSISAPLPDLLLPPLVVGRYKMLGLGCRIRCFNKSSGLIGTRSCFQFQVIQGPSKNNKNQTVYRPKAVTSRCTVKCAMRSYRLSDLSPSEIDKLKSRPRIDFSSIFGVVQPIVDDVRARGDTAVKEYTRRFDKVEMDVIVENVSDLPDPELDETVREAFDVAYNNIFAFHAEQKPVEKFVENMDGVRCKRVARSISSVGLYVPGGTAVLPSTALMLSVVW